jgi:DNA-binding transcriptional MerR regulator
MDMKSKTVIVLAIVLAAALASTALALARRGHMGRGGPWGDRLTEEQRDEIHAVVRDMREAGASREEIHEAVAQKIEKFGVELPEGWRERRRIRSEIRKQLTEEQRAAIRSKIRELHEAGASREEIHAAVREMLAGYGIELPQHRDHNPGSPAPAVSSEDCDSATWGEIKGEFR